MYLLRSIKKDWAFWLIPIAIMFVLTYLRYHSLGEPLERDVTTYAYIAHEMLSGEQLYSVLWDHKPPAIYWIYMLAELVGGYTPEAITYLGIVFSLLSCVFLFLFLMLAAGRWIALLGASFWSLGSNSLLLQANQPNTEIFLNTFTLMGLWSFALYASTSRKSEQSQVQRVFRQRTSRGQSLF